MPEHDLDTLLDWRGRTLLDRKHEKIGKIGDLYLDEETDLPAYAGVRTGLLGRRESIVPINDVVEQDGDLVVPYDADLVRDAPAINPDEALDEEEQARLAHHYDAPSPAATEDAEAGADADAVRVSEADSEQTASAEAHAPSETQDQDSRAGDREMIRSEEEVVTGTTEMRPAERVRLRKVLVTEQVTRKVPVRREEIRLETDPPPEGTIERIEDMPDEKT